MPTFLTYPPHVIFPLTQGLSCVLTFWYNRFMDVATRHDTLWPKVASIQAGSVGWVHLTRSLHAVTLFGVGFGELLRPIWAKGQTQACCSPTSLVPIGRDFLAVYGEDLQHMLRTGSKRRNPWKLAGNVHWHSPDGVAFESCKCKATVTAAAPRAAPMANTEKRSGLRGLLGLESGQRKDRGPGDMAQVLLPTSFPRLYGRELRSPTRVVPRGAVIFGHSWKFPLRWSLTKDIPPEEGEPDSPPSTGNSGVSSNATLQSSDSGLGTSIGSGSSLDNARPTTTTTTPHSLYGLGSNVGFLHRDQVAGPSESSGKGTAEEGR